MVELSSCDYLVIIVNYGTPQDVIDCLASLEPEIAEVDGQVAVVDNCSPDDSFESIAQAISMRGWGAWAELILADKNGGFAYGNNVAIQAALELDSPPRYFHLLNPDTVIETNALIALKTFMDTHLDVGIAGSRQKIYEGEWNKAFRFPGVISELDRGLRLGVFSRLVASKLVSRQMGADCAEAEWVSGASMVVRRDVIDAVGLMDERYFLYYEETDYCLAARRAGWSTWHVVDSVVFHKVGASTGVKSSNINKRIPKYVYESRGYYFRKNYGFIYALVVDLAFLAGVCGQRFLALITLRDLNVVPFLLRDTLRNGAFFSRARRKR